VIERRFGAMAGPSSCGACVDLVRMKVKSRNDGHAQRLPTPKEATTNDPDCHGKRRERLRWARCQSCAPGRNSLDPPIYGSTSSPSDSKPKGNPSEDQLQIGSPFGIRRSCEPLAVNRWRRSSLVGAAPSPRRSSNPDEFGTAFRASCEEGVGGSSARDGLFRLIVLVSPASRSSVAAVICGSEKKRSRRSHVVMGQGLPDLADARHYVDKILKRRQGLRTLPWSSRAKFELVII